MNTHPDLELLDRAIAFSQHRGMGKLIRKPLRIGRIRLLEELCRRTKSIRSAAGKTFWGDRFIGVVPEPVSCSVLRYGYFENELTRIVYDQLKPGMNFFDVGTHFGYFSLMASHLVGPAGKVHSFEPTRSTFEVLAQNAKGHANIQPFNIALFSKSTTLEFQDFGVRHSAYNSLYGARMPEEERARLGLNPQRVSIQATTMDEHVAKTGVRPSFIKIDAEGAELEIVRGMGNTITTCRPMITLEVGDWGVEGMSSSRQAIDAVIEFGYQPMEYQGGKIVPHQLKAKYDYDNLLLVPKTA